MIKLKCKSTTVFNSIRNKIEQLGKTDLGKIGAVVLAFSLLGSAKLAKENPIVVNRPVLHATYACKEFSSEKYVEVISRLKKSFNIKLKDTKSFDHQQVKKYVKQYLSTKKTLQKHTENASNHIYHIVNEVEKRNMPGELALLPMIESNFKIHAISCKGAAGIWQFMPKTGRQFGLKQIGNYDGRKDVIASTNAALKYLEYLHDKFNNDWMLALAAYNAGEGTVEKAIKRNKKAGLPISFWSLKLPKETREYVPKFLGLVKFMAEHRKSDITI